MAAGTGPAGPRGGRLGTGGRLSLPGPYPPPGGQPTCTMRPFLFGLFLTAALPVSFSLLAQIPEVVILGRRVRHAGVLRQLDLSPAQITRLNTLVDEEKAERQQRLTHRPDETEHAARRARAADFETKVEAVLTPAQRARYEGLRGLRPPRQRLPEMQVPK